MANIKTYKPKKENEVKLLTFLKKIKKDGGQQNK